MIRFSLKPTEPAKSDVDVLISFLYTDELSAFTLGEPSLDSIFTSCCEREQFSANFDESIVVSTKSSVGPYKVLVFGLGTREQDVTLFDIQLAIAKGVQRSKMFHPAKIACVLSPAWLKAYTPSEVAKSFVEAVVLSSYQFLKYKSEDQKKQRDLEDVYLHISAGKLQSAEQGILLGQITSSATVFARDLVNEPSVVTTPSYLAQCAKDIAKSSKTAIKVTILEKDDAQKLGMNSFLGVAKGSDEPPKFIVLSYKPASAHKKVVLVGKGVTFDTGGLSLKPAEHMETMKLDMAGAAAVLGVFHVLPQLSLNVEVVGIIAACENMPSGKALKPGDIVKAANGKTIEVLNTDAEGRLTLADAFSYAILKENPDEMIDLATLTGACMVALGTDIAGLWSNNSTLLSTLSQAALKSGEKVWPMPLEKSYKELIKSHIADVKNIQTGRYGGAVTAALFLEAFISNTPWAHLDIAGPAFIEKDTPLSSFGGAGFGVRLLLHYLQHFK